LPLQLRQVQHAVGSDGIQGRITYALDGLHWTLRKVNSTARGFATHGQKHRLGMRFFCINAVLRSPEL
jgi:hypothetical protein